MTQLLSLVSRYSKRITEIMGSFTSCHKIINEDRADEDQEFGERSSWDELSERCRLELGCLPSKIERRFCGSYNNSEIHPPPLRVMQWNVLSQALAVGSDNFVMCPPEALSWRTRRWRLLEEVTSSKPDILCLQEVDHYNFFRRSLGSLGFRGIFLPKPDSPCYYILGNNGPDGCAVFFDETQFELIDVKTRSLEVWGYQSNQVAILCHFKRKIDCTEFCVATTHLKARQGALLATLRHEQGKDLLEFIKMHAGQKPVIVTGDFNAGPTEAIYKTMTTDAFLSVDSAYRHLSPRLEEPPYTTWKIREDGECCQTLDYIFYSQRCFSLLGILLLPTAEDIGVGRVPSSRYPSDHFSLVADLLLKSSEIS